MGVDHPRGAGVFQVSDLGNAIPTDCNISRYPGIPGTVDDSTVLNDDVVCTALIRLRQQGGGANEHTCQCDGANGYLGVPHHRLVSPRLFFTKARNAITPET